MVDDNGPYKVDAMSHLKVSSPNLETTYAVRAYYNVNFNELYWANYMLSTPSIWYGSYCWPSILVSNLLTSYTRDMSTPCVSVIQH